MRGDGSSRNPFRGVRVGLGALALVLVIGTVGYLLFGFGLLDAIFQTVITITTVGFNSPHPLDGGSKVFTIVLILVGVGTALYTFSAVLEVLIDGHMRDLMRRRKMERDIDRMHGHVIVCGWGRVGREVARSLASGRRTWSSSIVTPSDWAAFPSPMCAEMSLTTRPC